MIKIKTVPNEGRVQEKGEMSAKREDKRAEKAP
jgi:hypothetical protein